MSDPLSGLEGSPYGAMVYDALTSTLEDTELSGYLSDPTVVQVGTFLTGAYTIATSGGSVKDIVDSSVMLALDLSANLISALLPAIADLVPIIGQLGGIIFAIGDISAAAQRRREQEMRAKLKAYRLKMMQRAQRYLPIGTGARGETVPADYFVQVRTEPRPPHPTGRVPSVGVVLEGLTETMWSEHISELGSFRRSLGLPNNKGPQEDPYPPWNDWLPMIGDFVPKMAELRRAVIDQSLVARPGQPTDGGQAVWPVYADLLYALLYVPVYPFGLGADPLMAEAGGYSPAPRIPRKVAHRVWGGPPWERPTILQNYADALAQGNYTFEGNKKRGPLANRSEKKDRLLSLAKPGHGDWTGAVDGIYEMIEDWGQQVRPLYFADQRQLADELATSLPQVEKLSRKWLSDRGLSGGTKLTSSVGEAIQTAVDHGLVSSSQATRAARKANAGVGVAAALALSALGYAGWRRFG